MEVYLIKKKLNKKNQKRKKKFSSHKPEKSRWRNNEWIEFRASDIGHPHQHFLNKMFLKHIEQAIFRN